MKFFNKIALAALVCTTAFNLSDAQQQKRPRQMWAQSYLFRDSPEMEFKKWLTDKPETDGKFIILEFWRTWCSVCKKVTPVFNKLQKELADDLVIIGVTGEAEDLLPSYKGPKKEYFLAIDADREPSEVSEEQVGCGGYAEDENVPACGSGQKTPQQGKTEAAYGVYGWPHVVVLEPEDRVVIWEGFPLQEGYELTKEKLEKYIAVYKESMAEKN